MHSTRIPEGKWRAMLDSLSRTYAGSLVSVEIAGGDVGAEGQLHDQPLRGITADRSGVNIMVGRYPFHFDHRISSPEVVRVVEAEDGAVMAVEIEETGGTCSLIRFRSAVRPELLDAAVE